MNREETERCSGCIEKDAEIERLQAKLRDLGAYGGIPEVVQENAATQENNRALTAEIKRLQAYRGYVEQFGSCDKGVQWALDHLRQGANRAAEAAKGE